MNFYVNDYDLYMVEDESFLPLYMKGVNLRKLEYNQEESQVSVVALDIKNKKALITKEDFDFKQESEFVDFVSGSFLINPTTPYLKHVNLGALKGRAIVNFTSDKLNVIILIDVEIPQKFVSMFNQFDFTIPGSLTDKIASILKNL